MWSLIDPSSPALGQLPVHSQHLDGVEDPSPACLLDPSLSDFPPVTVRLFFFFRTLYALIEGFSVFLPLQRETQ